jgi:regulatory protein
LSTFPPESAAALKARALRLLARREHSRQELARKLAPHAASSEDLQILLSDLEARRQLSDQRYAEERSHWLARKYGAAKIRHELRAKGIAEEIVEGISTEGELERARSILNRKYHDHASTRKERAKRARFLQSRGFSMGVITRLIRGSEELI